MSKVIVKPKKDPLIKRNEDGILIEYVTLPTTVLKSVLGFEVQQDGMWVKPKQIDMSKHTGSFVNLRREFRS